MDGFGGFSPEFLSTLGKVELARLYWQTEGGLNPTQGEVAAFAEKYGMTVRTAYLGLKEAREQGGMDLLIENEKGEVPTFEEFCATEAYPEYVGLSRWQKEFNDIVDSNKIVGLLAPRGHGKSIYLAWKFEYMLLYDEYDILYLGWTDRRKEVAQYVFNFFFMRNMVVNSKRGSEFNFQLLNGAKFNTYHITDRKILGFHGSGASSRRDDDVGRKLFLCIDDPIDDSFRDELHKERNLERRFMSTIYNIQPDKWLIVGTRKFEGDFFDYLKHKVFKDKMVWYVRGTHLKEGDPGFNEDPVNNPNNLLCPELFTEPGMPNYEEDVKNGKKDLAEIKLHVDPYWYFSEYEQDPHPITGQIFDKVFYDKKVYSPREFDIIVFSIDRATSMSKRADKTGFVIIGRIPNDVPHFIVFEDLTQKIEFTPLLELIETKFRFYKEQFPFSSIVVVIEKQGGGADIIQYARNNYELEFGAHIEDVYNNRKKKDRIMDYLGSKMKRYQIRFPPEAASWEVVEEILTFPNCRYFDAIDALATGIHWFDLHPNSQYLINITERISRVIRRERAKFHVRGYVHPWNDPKSPYYVPKYFRKEIRE